jgi:hypothetical protein
MTGGGGNILRQFLRSSLLILAAPGGRGEAHTSSVVMSLLSGGVQAAH